MSMLCVMSVICLMSIDTVECLIGRSINYRSLLQKSPIKETIFCVSIMCRMSMLCQCHVYRQCRMSILTYLLRIYHVSNVYVVFMSIVCLMPIDTVECLIGRSINSRSLLQKSPIKETIFCVSIMCRMSMLCQCDVYRQCRMSILTYLLRTYHVSNVYVVSMSIICLMERWGAGVETHFQEI